MKAYIEYTIPVVVFVDTETGEVERVEEHREELGSFWPVVTALNGDSLEKSVEDEVLDIAENNEWPEWELV